jgi:hypothetical protein
MGLCYVSIIFVQSVGLPALFVVLPGIVKR